MRAVVILALVAVAFATQAEEQNCVDEPDSGRCLSYFPAWYYDAETQICRIFIYGGCQGNGNRYSSEEECMQKCAEYGENEHFESCGTACPLTCENYKNPPKICVLRCDIGCQCDKGYVRAADGRCVRPEQCTASNGPIPCYAHPRANLKELYKTIEDVMTYDDDQKTVLAVDFNIDFKSQKANEQNCVDKPDQGRCLAYIPLWYYDASTQQCHEFVYGGCQGNGNRYGSKEECTQKCAGVVAEESDRDVCDMPAEVGVCRGIFRRYFYDKSTGTCQKFIYVVQSAGASAPSACLQEKERGKCLAYFQRYYFNKETGNCEKFIYGGCQGNSNNFNTKEDCEAVCKA